MTRRILPILATVFAAAAWAQQPRLTNAKVETRPVSGSLEQTFQGLVANQPTAAWIGYAAPIIAGERQMCCYNSSSNCCGGCGLEGNRFGIQQQQPATTMPGPVRLEGPDQFLVLFRVEARAVGKIRNFSVDCEIDAGGLTVYWLTGVSPEQSVALLAGFATSGPNTRDANRLRESALSALAMHRDPAADRALEQFVAPNQPDTLRERAAFWLGSSRGRRGYEIVSKMVREDQSDRVREKAIFALSVSKEPEAITAMITAARNDPSTRVRSQGLFWLAQKAGRQATEAITDAIARDPVTEVKKKAVFALSQLPKDEGIRLLIEVARTNSNPVVRKEAFFWLGQSRDPRALDFLEQVLTR